MTRKVSRPRKLKRSEAWKEVPKTDGPPKASKRNRQKMLDEIRDEQTKKSMAKRMKRKVHLPPKLEATEEQIATLEEKYSSGVSLEDAANAAGLNVKLIYLWETRANDPKDPYRSDYQALSARLLRAKASAHVAWAKKIELGASGVLSEDRTHFLMKPDWRAAARLLEMSNPQKYAPKRQVEIQVQVQIKDLLELMGEVCRRLPVTTKPEEVYVEVIEAITTGAGGAGDPSGDAGTEAG